MALSHQFIWSSTSLMLCFIFSGGRSLAWPTMAGSQKKTTTSIFLPFVIEPNIYIMYITTEYLSTLLMTVDDSYRTEKVVPLLKIFTNSRSTTLLDAEAPIPLLWIWYTGWVGRCPSFSILDGPGPEGWAAASGGVPGFVPSSLAFISVMGFSGTGAPPGFALWDDLALKIIHIITV